MVSHFFSLSYSAPSSDMERRSLAAPSTRSTDQPLLQRVLPRETEGLLKFVLCLLLHSQIPRLLVMTLAAIVP